MSLAKQESIYLEKKIGRKPTPTEFQIIAAEWSEHCSYKSSKKHLKMLPMKGPHILTEKGYDSGVIDVGGNYVVTVHIESHNHPSAVEPFGGAATGVGGVIRDILSTGTRPIAILDGLRFGDIEKDPHARWLFKNAVSGIADYGNCLGIPTIGGEVEFDRCYTNYALVDVAGFGKKDRLIKNRADKGDLVVLLGGPTGRDGIGGSQFASDSLESQDRSAVQIPDPFIEKLIIEAILEARNQKCIKAMKDLGGGGLSCAISETADSLGIGIELDVDQIYKREEDMKPEEVMISESQERMLIITDKKKFQKLKRICKKFSIQCSIIGKVTSDHLMRVKKGPKTLAALPTNIVANAPLIERPSAFPKYLKKIQAEPTNLKVPNISTIILKMISNPNIANKNWVYGQYDHEVGIRTVIKPGHDASVLRLDNGKFLAAKIDGNPKQCYIDPKQGAIGCFEEACRNVVCCGATPIGMVDHLQFGSPEDPEIFWTFLESLKGITEFAKSFKIPCVGGKVSFYNETPKGPIKPTPLIAVLGIIDKHPLCPVQITSDDVLVIVGKTKNELGGSEYFEYIHDFTGGKCPEVDFEPSKKNMDAILTIIRKKLVKCVHDCSKGGLAIAISELCMMNNIGCKISLETIPSEKLAIDRLLFSESHSRYLIVTTKNNLGKIKNILSQKNVDYNIIGNFEGTEIIFEKNAKKIANLSVDKTRLKWMNSLEELVLHG
jgi:phosphoribosylformylglycinamidine synthase